MSMTNIPEGGRPLTGRKVLIIALCAFAVVIIANVTMATFAISGFPGLVTKNPYAAGQTFQVDSAAERALGWQVSARWEQGHDKLAVDILDAGGAPEPDLAVTVMVGRPATDAYDLRTRLVPRVDGAYAVPLDLAPGVWRVEVTAMRPRDGARFVIVDQIRVPAP